ncbi:hypothetical protein, partial [Bremerella alba]|uniref:hypothetical protein n=1 Tax=Bremerella alba TaxID=980252 RepID=UPI001A954B1D
GRGRVIANSFVLKHLDYASRIANNQSDRGTFLPKFTLGDEIITPGRSLKRKNAPYMPGLG